MRPSFLLLSVLALAPIVACGVGTDNSEARAEATHDELRDLSREEALNELTVVGELIRNNYGPLEWKRARYGFELDTELAIARAKIEAATNEAGRIRPFYELLAKLKDGHVGFMVPLRGDTSAEWALPFTVTPIQGKYYVSFGTDAIKRGDRLVSIDGITTDQLEADLLPIAEIGTLESSRHRVAGHITRRAAIAPDHLKPTSDMASITFERPIGTTYTVDIAWTKSAGGLAGMIIPPTTPGEPSAPVVPNASAPTDLSLGLLYDIQLRDLGPQATKAEQGNAHPYWLTAEVKTQLGLSEVLPKNETLVKYALAPLPEPTPVPVAAADGGAPPTNADGGVPHTITPVPTAPSHITIRAFKYQFGDKKVLLIRIPTFSPAMRNMDEHVGWMSALIDDEQALPAELKADVLVLDVSHNPGGAVTYVQGLASLFTKEAIPCTLEASRASRMKLSALIGQANANASTDLEAYNIYKARAEVVETAFDNNQLLAPFAPLIGGNFGPRFVATGMWKAGGSSIQPHPLVQWDSKTPILVMHDELSGSGGDALPKILQYSGVAKTFGARTAGMGGSRGDFMLLHTGGFLSLTNGLIAPSPRAGESYVAEADYIENNGVTPDFAHELTIDEFRGQYVGYVRAFSETAVGLVK